MNFINFINIFPKVDLSHIGNFNFLKALFITNFSECQ